MRDIYSNTNDTFAKSEVENTSFVDDVHLVDDKLHINEDTIPKPSAMH